jgi:hypothetical protein
MPASVPGYKNIFPLTRAGWGRWARRGGAPPAGKARRDGP